jgi:uncharacterized membrane protein YfcA
MNTEMIITIFFPLLIFIVALLYASVGHGGASGYLAVMALIGIAPEEMRSSALLLNLFVSAISYLQFRNAVNWNRTLFFSLAIPSVVMAYWGSSLDIDDRLYKKILGLILLIPIVKMLLPVRKERNISEHFNWPLAFLMGAAIGLISGLIGIGGGILLSPLLILLGWTNMKQTAAISALFIFVNSLAGLLGQFKSGFVFNCHLLYWVIAALAGGFLGGRWGAGRFKDNTLRYVLALVLSLAAFKLLMTTA